MMYTVASSMLYLYNDIFILIQPNYMIYMVDLSYRNTTL